MDTYELSLVIDREPADAELESVAAELDDAGVVGFETDGGSVLAHLAIEAPSLVAAIAHGVHHVEALGQLGLQVLGVASGDLVSIRDIAVRTERTYESVRLLAGGQRGPGGFPAPLSTGRWALYSWAEVSAWFAEHYGSEAPGAFDREIAAADYLIRARRMLAGDEHRDELAKLFAA